MITLLLTLLMAHADGSQIIRGTTQSRQVIRRIQSPKKTFVIEIVELAREERYERMFEIYVISNHDKRVRNRLQPDHIHGKSNMDETGFEGDFYISPDEKWIFRVAKYVHTVSIASLYHEERDMDFQLATPLRFDEAAWRYYAGTIHMKRSQIPSIDRDARMIHYCYWSADSRRLIFDLYASRGLHREKTRDWNGCFQTRSRTFREATRDEMDRAMRVENRH